jgi:hypothetical protein
MRQQGSDGAKLRQKDVAFTTPAHDQESEDVYVVDQ